VWRGSELTKVVEKNAAKRTRTSNLLIRSQMLYPIELWPRG
jgi:hypothetical protein